MKLFSRWFTSKQKSSIKDEVINAGTHVSTKALISLQQLAHKLDMRQQSYARSSTTGAHHSKFRGRGMDYQESRIYQAGDDIRNMDWRVTARAGKPHTKLYQEERERPVTFVVDFNPSMFFGSKNLLKSVLASKVAALIAWSVSARGDRIGALLMAESYFELSPKTGKRGVLQFIGELVQRSNPQTALSQPQTPVNLNTALKRLQRLAKSGSLLFLISDFYDIDSETEHLLQQLRKHNDIQAIQIVDPLEKSPPPANRYTVTNGSATGLVNTRSKTGFNKYQNHFSQHHEKIQLTMSKQRIPLFQISTDDDLLLVLQQGFGNSKPRSAHSNSISQAKSVVSEQRG